ncbi:hypothetical protein ACET3Z_019891 [Daucus carota]
MGEGVTIDGRERAAKTKDIIVIEDDQETLPVQHLRRRQAGKIIRENADLNQNRVKAVTGKGKAKMFQGGSK